MSGGGKLIEILPMRLESGRDVLRLWVIDARHCSPGFGAETCLYAEPQESLPALGDTIWWGGERWIMFDNDRQQMTKVGYSFAAPGSRQ